MKRLRLSEVSSMVPYIHRESEMPRLSILSWNVWSNLKSRRSRSSRGPMRGQRCSRHWASKPWPRQRSPRPWRRDRVSVSRSDVNIHEVYLEYRRNLKDSKSSNIKELSYGDLQHKHGNASKYKREDVRHQKCSCITTQWDGMSTFTTLSPPPFLKQR